MFKSSRSYAAITKSVEEVQLPHEIGNIMRRAFAQVKNGRSGPVMVEVPVDIVGAEVDIDPSGHRPLGTTDRPAMRATLTRRRRCCSTPPVR